MKVGELSVKGMIASISLRSDDNNDKSIIYNTTHINGYTTQGVCCFTHVLNHEPRELSADQLELRDSFNYRGNGMERDEFDMAESGYGDYWEFAVYEFVDGQYVLNPEMILEVWYALDYDKYYGRMNINNYGIK